MVQQELSFGTEGPLMSGTWVNPKTGHKFTVLDCFFQDNQFIVQTTDGQMLDYNTIQDYVQCTDANGRETAIPSNMLKPKTATELPPEIASEIAAADQIQVEEMLPEDRAILGNLNHRTPQQLEHAAAGHRDPVGPKGMPGDANADLLMVQRVLNKHAKPQVEAKILWETPERQIDTLINVLGIEPEVVAEYYMNYMDMDAVYNLIRSKLTDYINKVAQLPTNPVKEPTPVKEETENQPSNDPAPKSRTRKRTKL